MNWLKKISLISLLSLSVKIGEAQVIEWREDRPLTWKDFQGPPDYNSTAAAVTVWSIRYTYDLELKDSIYKITFHIHSIFYKKKSWVKRFEMDSEYGLRHEQTHFDINELYARKLAAAFKSAVYTSNYKAEIEAIYAK